MNYYKDKETGDVHAYDDEQMAVIARINASDFDNEKEQVSAIFFEIDEKIKGMHKMTKKEVEVHINPPVTREQQITEAEAEKQRLIAEVHTETEMLRAKLALKRIKPDEEALLIAWLDYLDELEAVDVSAAPDIIWPVKPAV
ncbi:tail fiber assembly protein [Morganella morganii]|uniref:tail fiber assembly protein n=1 Tax=Morganella morganii TaxID=582 RepID=UPI0037521553